MNPLVTALMAAAGRRAGVPPLLDTYSGAAAAYSLRQLSSSFTGDVITVRRSSDDAESGFTPTEISDGTLATWCGAGDGFVKTWHDQSGNTKDATQSTSGNQPQIVSSGAVITENGKPAIQFDGSNDQLLAGAISALTGTSAKGILCVFSPSDVSDAVLFAGNDAAGPGQAFLFQLDSGDIQYRTYGSGYDITGSSLSTENHYLASFLYNAPGLYGYLNSSSDGSLPAQTVDTAHDDSFRIGSTAGDSRFYSGKMQEVLLFSSSIESSRSGIESNINSHYGIY